MALDPKLMQLLTQSLLGGGGGQQQQGGGQFGSQGAGTLGLGAVQTVGSLIMLNRLMQTPRDRFDVTPEQQASFDRAEGMAREGFSAPERAAFQQNVSQSQQGMFQNARQMSGGGLGRAIMAGLLGGRLSAFNQFAGQDAALMRQNIRYADNRGDAITQQRNRQTGENLRYRDMQERAVGQSLQSGLTNLAGGVNANQALGNKFGGGGGMSGGQSGFGMPDNFGAQQSGFQQGLIDQSAYPNLYGNLPF